MRSSKGLCRLGLEWEDRGLDELGFSFLMRQQFCFESRVHQVTDGGAEGDYEERFPVMKIFSSSGPCQMSNDIYN